MAKRIWVERTSDTTFEAHSSTGASITFGYGDDLFDPGDLVKIAAAGCAVSSSRFPVDHTIGSDAPLSADIDAAYDRDEDRFTDFSENITVDASGSDLSDADAETLAKRVRAYIEKQCTVAHTYRQATPVTISVTVKR